MSFCPVAVTSLVCPPRPATAVCESGLFEERTNAPKRIANGNVNADRTTAEQAHTHMSQRLHLRKPSVVDFLIPRARGETTSTTALTGHCACHGACATALHTPAEHFSLPPWAVWCVPALRVPLVHSLILTPVSDISGLPYLQHQGEVLSLRDYHKWILRPILGIGRDRMCSLFMTHVGWLPPLGC